MIKKINKSNNSKKTTLDNKCCDNPNYQVIYKNNSNIDGSGTMGITHKIFKCINCENIL